MTCAVVTVPVGRLIPIQGPAQKGAAPCVGCRAFVGPGCEALIGLRCDGAVGDADGDLAEYRRELLRGHHLSPLPLQQD